MQEINIAALKRLFDFHWDAELLATADPYLVWADLTDASAIQSPTSEHKKIASVRIFVETTLNGQTTYATEDCELDKLQKRLLKAALRSERVELSSPLRAPGYSNIQVRHTQAPLTDVPRLTKDVLAVIDFGCPFAHNALRSENGLQTRVRYLWDQDPNRTVRPELPLGKGHHFNQKDLANQNPPIDFQEIDTSFYKYFRSSFKAPEGTDYAFLLSRPVTAKLDATAGNLVCQFSLIDDPAAFLALPQSKYWSPPFVSVNGVDSGQVITYGRELVPDKIKEIFADCVDASEAEIYAASAYDDLTDGTSHGAHILSTATGWPNLAESVTQSDPETDTRPAPERDAASNVDVIFVQLPATTVADTSGNSLGGYVNDALEYILARTDDDSRVVVNLSYGCYAGPHDGSSLIEKAMDAAIERGRERQGTDQGFNVVVAAGNSFQAGCHAMLKLKAKKRQTLQWAIQPDDETWSFVEIWYRDSRTLEISIMPPFETAPLGRAGMNSVLAFGEDDTPLCTIVHSGNASERDGIINRMALIAVAPTRSRDGARATAPYGVWTIGLASTDDVTVDAWIERDDPILVQALERRQSVFVTTRQGDDYVDKDYIRTSVTKYGTINGIATGKEIIAVGSTIATTNRPSKFSAAAGRPWDVRTGTAKVQEMCAADEATLLQGRLAFGNHGSGTYRRTGTSVAAAMYSRRLLNEARTPTTQPSPGTSRGVASSRAVSVLSPPNPNNGLPTVPIEQPAQKKPRLTGLRALDEARGVRKAVKPKVRANRRIP